MIKIREISIRESLSGYTSCIMATGSEGHTHSVISHGKTWRDAYDNAVTMYLELNWDKFDVDYLSITKKFIGG